MTRQVKRAFKYRFYLTNEQAAELSRTFGCVRLVYNKALEERTRAWYGEQRRVSYVQSSAALTAWKKTGELAFLAEVSSVPLLQALRHLQTAFGNFFAQRAKYPRYKSRKKSRASAEYTRSAFTWREGRLTLAKMAEPLDIRWSRPLPEGTEPTTVTVSRDAAGRWFTADVPALVRLLVDDAVLEMPPVPLWYRGSQDYGRFLQRVFRMRGASWRMRELTANGQPALAAYAQDSGGGYRLHTLQVFTVTDDRVAHNVVFADPRVFDVFELPREIPAGGFRRER
ncbi:ketosteroid isomerase-like protein [Streptomyces canus]|uniref:RNA-guided endonuclease TnpB family protein n=1 Tax=Streptomyces canus TaxID=58343 RepID=UPI00278A4AAF|nr:ketosteroid isomerase-like protein [Streptomyces canus]